MKRASISIKNLKIMKTYLQAERRLIALIIKMKIPQIIIYLKMEYYHLFQQIVFQEVQVQLQVKV